MPRLDELATVKAGILTTRVSESRENDAVPVCIYGQTELLEDLHCIIDTKAERNEIWVASNHDCPTIPANTLVFSLVSGMAAITLPEHEGYIQTHNIVTIVPKEGVDAAYLAWILNEDQHIKRQKYNMMQGSITHRYSLSQVKELEIQTLPSLAVQKVKGRAYSLILKKEKLSRELADKEKLFWLCQLERAGK